MKEVVFTSFGPFRDVAHNPSILVASHAAEEVRRCGGSATAIELAVTYAEAEGAARTLNPRALRLHVGLAAHRPVVTVERCARPESGAEPDMAGIVGAAAPPGAVPLESELAAPLLAALLAEGVAAQLSEDAGGYVCNALLWHSLAEGADACFVHVPSMDEAASARFGRQLGRAAYRLLAGMTST